MEELKGGKKNICIGLLAHVDAGKTTLSEEMLHRTGVLEQAGRVDKGNAFLDTYELEKSRGITIFSKQAVFEWNEIQFTMLDTPGHVDFSAEMERTLQVLDYGILVISALDGVQGHTMTLWQLLKKHEIPCFIFVNKMDQPGAKKQEILGKLRTELSEGIVDFDTEDDADRYESIALCDEEALEQFLEQEKVDVWTVQKLLRKRKIFPCFFGSALQGYGVEKLLDIMAELVEEKPYGEEFGARVFKITRDAKGNRLTHVKITGGSLKAREEISDRAKTWSQKVNEIRIYSGEKYKAVQKAEAGMICALTGLTETRAGEGLGKEIDGELPLLEPVLTYRIALPEKVAPAVMLPKLRMLEEEEPQLHIVWDEKNQEIQVQVMGDVQIEILQHEIKQRFGIDTAFDAGAIVYKETIKTTVHGAGHFEPLRHYAEVHLLMEPGEAGSGITVESRCSEDMLDKNWQRLIFTHILEKEHKGVLTGSTLTDVKITLMGGRAHLKHTEGGDFRQATYRAVRQGLMQAESVLLEPYYHYQLEVPDEMMGRAMTDLEQMQASFELDQSRSGTTKIEGDAPVARMRNYAREVTAYTRGQGKFSCVPAGYHPCKEPDQIIEKIGYDPERDVENPSSSVFCAHGSGYYVPWDQVMEHAHVTVETGEKKKEEEVLPQEAAQREEIWLGVDEIDAILAQASSSNRKSSPISHKGISAKRTRSVRQKPEGLQKPARPVQKKEKFMLVDGYNILFAWEELAQLAARNIDSARGKLMDILCNYQGYLGIHLILVFDAYRVQNHATESIQYHNITVVYTKEAETADQYIEKFSHENGKKYDIVVATSDGLEQIIIRGAGCRLMSARELKQDVARVEKELAEFKAEE